MEFLTWVWNLHLDLDIVFGHYHTHVLNFGSLFWFWRCKEYPYPLSPDLGLWRRLEIPNWGSASRSWFWYGHRSLEHPCSEFWLSVLILKVQTTFMSICPNLVFGGHWRFLTGVWHPDIDLDMVTGLWYTLDPNFGSLSWSWRCKENICPLGPHWRFWGMLEVPDWSVAS